MTVEFIVFFSISAFSISVLIYGGVALVRETFVLGQVAPATGIKIGYVYLAVPISGFFITIYSIEFMIESILKLKNLPCYTSWKNDQAPLPLMMQRT